MVLHLCITELLSINSTWLFTSPHTHLVSLPISLIAVVQIRLLKSRRRHPRIILLGRGTADGCSRGGWDVWLMEAGLDQSLPSLARDHGLELRGGKGVDMASLRGHHQHHLIE